MAVKKDLNVHRRVRIAMSVLPPPQRDAVNRVIHSSRGFTDYTSDSARVKKIESPGEQLYMIRITPQLRLVYTETGNAIQVLDLVERATMESFSAKKARKKVGRARNGESGSIEMKAGESGSTGMKAGESGSAGMKAAESGSIEMKAKAGKPRGRVEK